MICCLYCAEEEQYNEIIGLLLTTHYVSRRGSQIANYTQGNYTELQDQTYDGEKLIFRFSNQ